MNVVLRPLSYHIDVRATPDELQCADHDCPHDEVECWNPSGWEIIEHRDLVHVAVAGMRRSRLVSVSDLIPLD